MTPSTPSPDSRGRRCRPCFANWRQRGCATPGFNGFAPDACLINRYVPGAKMSLHQDKDEQDFAAPIVSVSLGLPAIFLFGGPKRADKPNRYRLEHGDVVVWGGPSRLFFHGVAPLADGEHAADGPPAHQPDFSQGAVITSSPAKGGGRGSVRGSSRSMLPRARRTA